MKNLLLPRALAAPLAVLAGGADAQKRAPAPVPANQTWCLESGDESGVHPLLCRFTTLEQCNASKASHVDQCMLNPVLTFQTRR